jgi:hypothetical protein
LSNSLRCLDHKFGRQTKLPRSATVVLYHRVVFPCHKPEKKPTSLYDSLLLRDQHLIFCMQSLHRPSIMQDSSISVHHKATIKLNQCSCSKLHSQIRLYLLYRQPRLQCIRLCSLRKAPKIVSDSWFLFHNLLYSLCGDKGYHLFIKFKRQAGYQQVNPSLRTPIYAILEIIIAYES